MPCPALQIESLFISKFKRDDFIVSPSMLNKYASSIPDRKLANRLINYYVERRNRSRSQPVMGEIALPMFAEMFGVNRIGDRYISDLWMLVYIHSLLLDDILDGQSSQPKFDLLLSQYLLDDAITVLYDLDPVRSIVWPAFLSCRRRSWKGILFELHAERGKIDPEESVRDILQGEKAAMAQFAATLITYASERRMLTQTEDDAVSSLCAGIQLLDDIGDLEEDFSWNRGNTLNDVVCQWLRNGCNLTEQELSEVRRPYCIPALVVFAALSGGLSQSWKRASMHLENALGLFANRDQGQFSNIVESMIIGGRESADLLEAIVSSHPLSEEDVGDIVRRIISKGTGNLMSELEERMGSDQVSYLVACVQAGPRACN